MAVFYPYVYNLGTDENILATYNQVTLNGGSPASAGVRNNLIQLPAFGSDYVVLTNMLDIASIGRVVAFIDDVVSGDSFRINTISNSVTNTVNWFLIVNNSVSNYSGTTVFLPWIDLQDRTQSYGTITMSSGQATLTSKYLAGSTSAEAISRIFLTVNTQSNSLFPAGYNISNYNAVDGSVTITATLDFDASVLNYFILTKNNNPYISVSGDGTYPSIIMGGSGATCGISRLVTGQVTVNTNVVTSGSIIIASTYGVNSSFPGTIYVPTSEIVPGVSFNIHSTSNVSTSDVAWFIIAPASDQA